MSGGASPKKGGDRSVPQPHVVEEDLGPSSNSGWLAGAPMDPVHTLCEPLPALPGFPFLHRGMCASIVGPTGGGRSSLIQACAYNGARAGLRVAYLGSEVTKDEFNARAAQLAHLYGDAVDDALRKDLARVRYLHLPTVIAQAWEEPASWVPGVTAAFDAVLIDPLSAVESTLGLNFEQRNTEFIRFYDKLVQPVTSSGVAVVLVDNVGHAIEAKNRPKGVSAKGDRADLTFSCAPVSSPVGLVVKAHKVRSIRAAIQRGDEWLFSRDSQTIERRDARERSDDGGFRPTVLMQRVSEFVEEKPGSSLNAVKRGAAGKREYVEAALERLIEEGFVERREEGQTRRHYSLRPYREGDDQPRPEAWASVSDEGLGNTDSTEARESPMFPGDGTEAQPRPNRGPASVTATEAPRPGYVVPGTRASVGDEPDADCELDRLRSKFPDLDLAAGAAT